MVSFDEILDPSTMDERIPWHRKVDKNGRFYHATQRAANIIISIFLIVI